MRVILQRKLEEFKRNIHGGDYRLQSPHHMRTIQYIHELTDWPNFHWDRLALSKTLADVRHRQGRLVGRMEGLGFKLQQEAVLETLTEDVLKSSEINGSTH